jgi:probable HAF family extracellular repeat protein
MTGLGDLAGGLFSSRATAVCHDGSVVVGAGYSASGQEAFLWTAGTGMVGLGDLAGGSFNSVANGVSADGSVVVGYSSSATAGAEPFIWDATSGMRSLTFVLAAGGADLSDWQLSNALGISANGRFVVGFGTHSGQTEGFLADLGVVPEPGSLGLLALAGCAALLRRQRRSRGGRA